MCQKLNGQLITQGQTLIFLFFCSLLTYTAATSIFQRVRLSGGIPKINPFKVKLTGKGFLSSAYYLPPPHKLRLLYSKNPILFGVSDPFHYKCIANR